MSKCKTNSDPTCKNYAEKVKNKANEKTPFEIDKPTKHFQLIINIKIPVE